MIFIILGQHVSILIESSSDPSKKTDTYLEIQSGPKKCIHSLLINIFGINLNEISISG